MIGNPACSGSPEFEYRPGDMRIVRTELGYITVKALRLDSGSI